MTYTFLHCMGFESAIPEIGDIAPLVQAGFDPAIVPGTWSNYSYNHNAGAGTFTFASTLTDNVWSSFNWRPSTASGNDVIWKDDTGVNHISLDRDSATGKARVFRNLVTSLASSTNVITPNAWHSVEVFIHIDDATGRVIVIIDNVTEIDFTGDTRNAGNVGLVSVGFGDHGNDVWTDDWIFGTGTSADHPGPPKVQGLMANGDGFSTQLTKSPTSVSRFYFSGQDVALSNTDSTIVTNTGNNPYISPSPDAAWDKTAGMVRRNLATARGLDSRQKPTLATSPVTASGNEDILICQFISPPIAAQTLSSGGAWTVKGQFQLFENSSTDDEDIQLVIRVLSQDGTSITGTLLAASTAALASELNQSIATNRKLPKGGTSNTLTQVVANDGDRIVVELGVRHHGSTTTSSIVYAIGTNMGASDLAEDETDTGTTKNAWIEFSSPITLSTTKGNGDMTRGVPSDNNTYVGSATVDQLDLYTMDDLSSFDSILGATLYAKALRASTGSGNIALAVRQASTTSLGSDVGLANTAKAVYRDMALDPTDSTAWDTTKINSLQAGVKTR